MRNKLFATAKGGISVSWYIAVLFSLFVAAVANGKLSASNTNPADKQDGNVSLDGASYVASSANQSGIDSYTKLMLHADGLDQGDVSFTDSETNKIVSVPMSPKE